MATTQDAGRRAARIQLVEDHVRIENAHDLDRLMATFGDSPEYVLNHEHIPGREGVHAFYDELLRGFPDLHSDTKHRHVGDEAIVLEVVITGTQRQPWRGIPATGRAVEVPLCAVFTFDAQEKLAGERIYFDTALMLQQLGVLPAPESAG